MEPIALIVSVATLLATPTLPERTAEPILYPDVVPAAYCEPMAIMIAKQVEAEIFKEQRVRVRITTRCVVLGTDTSVQLFKNLAKHLGSK